MDDKPVNYTDYETIFGNMDASQVAFSATTACAAATFPIIPSSPHPTWLSKQLQLSSSTLQEHLFAQFSFA
jgi:hypothetical protein